MPCAKVMLSIKGSRITKNVKHEIHKAIHDNTMRTFLIKKYEWTVGIFDSIDWPSHSACLRKRPALYTPAIMKLVHRWQPTMQKTSYYTQDNQRDTCTLCGGVETHHHYMYCGDDQYRLARKNEWLKLKKYATMACAR